VALLRAADECGDGGYADDRATRRRLLGELCGGCVDCVVCAGEVCGYSLVPQVGCDSVVSQLTLARLSRDIRGNILKKLSELADACIADDYV